MNRGVILTGPSPKMRDSGIEWLGQIPERWEVKRLKLCVQKFESGGTPDSDNPDYWTEEETGIPWVAIGDMTRSFRVHSTTKRLTETGVRSKRLPILRAGTLLYSMYASLGKVAILDVDAVVNQAILGLVTRDNVVSRDYLRWWLEFMQGHVQMLSSSNTQDNLNADKVRQMPIFVPPTEGQRAIAARLDRETARIDALIEKKQRQIDLLQERRAALISNAVTKGISQKVKMRDSGIEWLGPVPEHWEVKRLKFITPHVTVGIVVTPSKFYIDEGVPCLRSLNVREGRLTDTDLVFISPESNELHAKSMLKAGDVVAVRSGQPGTTAVVDKRYDGANCIDLIIIRQSSVFDSIYLSYAMGSHYIQSQFGAGSGGAIQQHFNIETASSLLIALPPLSEQVAIREYLDAEAGRLAALHYKVQTSIAQLQEYRSTLISAAVTGKIDIRQEIPA